jgi:ribosome-binding protein aMBF1 (putative translation factor)
VSAPRGRPVRDRRCTPTALDATGHAVRNNIRMLRMHRGWSREQLALRLDERGWPVSEMVLRRIEGGRRHINVDELAIFAKVFRVEAAVMLQPISLPAMRAAC